MSSSVLYVYWIIAVVHGIHHIEKKGTLRQSAIVKRTYLDCAEITKVEPEMILQLKKGNWMEHERLKQWVLCVLIRNSHMTDQGVLQLDVALSGVPAVEKDRVEKIIDRCLPTKRVMPREIAYRYAKCFHYKAGNYSLF